MEVEKINFVDPFIPCPITLSVEPLINEYTVDLIYDNACIHIGPNAAICILLKLIKEVVPVSRVIEVGINNS